MENIWDVMIFFLTILVPSTICIIYFTFYKPIRSCQDFMYAKYSTHFIFVGASLAGFCLAPLTLFWPSEIVRTSTTWLIGVTVGFLIAAFVSATVHVPVLYNNRCCSIYEYLEDRFHSKFLRYCAFIFHIFTSLVFVICVLILSSAFTQRSLNNVLSNAQITGWMCILFLIILTGSVAALGGQKATVYLGAFTLLIQFFLALLGAVAMGMYRRNAESFYVVDDTKTNYSIENDTISNLSKNDAWNWFSSPLAPDYRLSTSFGQSTIIDQQNVWLTTLACVLYFFYILGCQQTSHQYYCSVTTKNRARLSLACTALFFLIIWSLTFLLACLMLRFFADPAQLLRNCFSSSSSTSTFSLISDPYTSLRVFFSSVWTSTDGALGYFLACFTCVCAFCCLPSIFVSLATSVYEDLVKPYCINAQESRQILVLKILTIIFASLSAIGALLVSELFLNGHGGQMWWIYFKNACLTLATCTTPFAALYVLAIWLPCTNRKGAIAGLTFGIVLTLTLSLIHLIHLPFDYHVQQPNSLLYTCCDQDSLFRNLQHAGLLNGSMRENTNGVMTRNMTHSPSENDLIPTPNASTLSLANTVSCVGYDTLTTMSQNKLKINAIYRISFPLHSILAFLITIMIGLMVSLSTEREPLDWHLVYWSCNTWDNLGIEHCLGKTTTNSLDSRCTTSGIKTNISDHSHGNKKRFHRGPYTISESFRYSKEGPLPDTSYLNPKVQHYMATLTRKGS